MSSLYSPGRSPGSSRLQVGGGGGGGGVGGGVGGASRLRSSSIKKPPEPLRRAVADCLASSAASSHHASTSSSVLLSEASRILRDYLASPTTMDLSYSVILEHTIAERERSPAVVARCVALLKRYLLRYKPSEETLLQIDRFCVNTIAEGDIGPNRKLSPWSQSVASTASTNTLPLSVPSFASGTLEKSLNYVRSLVSQHLPRRSFHPGAFSGALSATRQSLPSLSSLLSRSFNGQLSPVRSGESSENKDVTTMSILNISNIEKVDGMKDLEYLALDVLRWRWLGEQQSSLLLTESDRVANSREMRTYNLLEVGAAALLVGDLKAKMKGQPWKFFGTADMPYLDQLLQPSPVSAITDSSAARAHLRAITACKRTKSGPSQIWDESPASTFRPRAKPLFQYRHYSEQQPLGLNPAEVCEVIAAVCSEASSPTANLMTVSSRLNNNYGKPSMDAAVSVLIKLVIDMYVLDSGTAAPLALSMLQEMLSSPTATCRVRAFDFILNLGVHAHLLEPVVSDDASTIEEDYSQESYFDSEAKLATQEMRRSDSVLTGTSSAIDDFESWILNILYEILLLLVQIEEKEESVWASALSCLLYFVCDRGKILRNRINGLDIRVVKALLVISRKNSWAEVVHCKLISMLANMFYQLPEEADETVPSTRLFVVEQVDLIGGIEFIFVEYSLAKSKDERRNLFLVLFDYVLHQINEASIATGGTEYSDDEIQPLVALLTMADASEAVYICIKLGLTGIGELMKNSISDAVSRYPNSERLNMMLESVMEKFGATISSFTHLDTEFFHMMEITKSYKSLDSIEGAVLRNGVGMKAKLSWAVLHSLLHSGNIAYHRNAYVWLGDLLIAEISDERNSSIWSNIKNMQQKIFLAGGHDSTVAADVPIPIWLMCGLLKSKHSIIRWGFLFVLERLLMRCKILLNENKTQPSHDSDIGSVHTDNRLEKANAVIDIMSSALFLVYQINETDRMNILKMCDILFSQLCLRVPPTSATEVGEDAHRGRVLFRMDGNKKVDDKDNYQDVSTEETSGRSGQGNNNPLEHGTESMAALLLRGQAIVPMQLVTRVPAALFYWPLFQLAGAATDNIALGIAVGSKGRGNLPGATSDIRATLLLLLIGKCTADPTAFQEVGGEECFRGLLDDTDSRVAYYSSAFLLKRMMTEKPEKYQHMLQNLVVRAQQSNNEKLLENPYLQMRGILQLANDLGTGL